MSAPLPSALGSLLLYYLPCLCYYSALCTMHLLSVGIALPQPCNLLLPGAQQAPVQYRVHTFVHFITLAPIQYVLHSHVKQARHAGGKQRQTPNRLTLRGQELRNIKPNLVRAGGCLAAPPASSRRPGRRGRLPLPAAAESRSLGVKLPGRCPRLQAPLLPGCPAACGRHPPSSCAGQGARVAVGSAGEQDQEAGERLQRASKPRPIEKPPTRIPKASARMHGTAAKTGTYVAQASLPLGWSGRQGQFTLPHPLAPGAHS